MKARIGPSWNSGVDEQRGKHVGGEGQVMQVMLHGEKREDVSKWENDEHRHKELGPRLRITPSDLHTF